MPTVDVLSDEFAVWFAINVGTYSNFEDLYRLLPF